MKNPRRLALQVLGQLFDHGRSFGDTLEASALQALEPADRSLCRALCFGVARNRQLIDALIGRLLERPLKSGQSRLALTLALGVFQLGWMRIPAHAAVNETVKLTRQRWERGLVNAVLRRFEREGSDITLDEAPAATRFSCPPWLAAEIAADWPVEQEAVLAACNAPAPMWLRVDPRRCSRTAYMNQLAAKALTAFPGVSADAVRMETPLEITALPGFEAGVVSVQDGAAQLASPLLPDVGSGRILDACAAPGGKTLHLEVLQPEAKLYALEINPRRIERMRENLDRVGANAQVVCGDATEPRAWWDGIPFDAVLLDAPCSGSGVIRRHPDIKWLRRAEDVAALMALQDRLLDAAWSVTRPGGTLVYTTCSILRRENDQRIASFRERHGDAEPVPLELAHGRPMGFGWQILPGEGDCDGFFYARFRRT